nr:zinc finger, CCHC-type [Tanacetum cinerariifolium]
MAEEDALLAFQHECGVCVLATPMPEDRGDNPTMDKARRRAKWDNDDYVCRGLIVNAYFMLNDDVAWWVDSRETVHVCKNRCWFKTYESLNDGSILHMGNESTALVHGCGYVDLRFSYGKTRHVYFKRMQYISKDGLISALDMDTKKFKTCMLTKITKKPFQNIKHETKVLELIHSDLCDLHATLSLGNKKYFVTFIDDASRPQELWNENWEAMSEDILHKKRKLFKYPELELRNEQIQNYCIMEIKEWLNRHGRDLSDFLNQLKPNPKLVTNIDNRLIREALAFDTNKGLRHYYCQAGERHIADL